MKQVSAKNLIDGNTTYLTYAEVDQCPRCKVKIVPQFLDCTVCKNTSGELIATVTDFCNGCKSVFISEYKITSSRNGSGAVFFGGDELIFSEPNRFASHIFDEDIGELSPNFVEIYNQALAAENMSLNQIAGIGYRKALEFLVKDYAKSEYPGDEEKIKTMPLSKCVTAYIDDSRIKTLAERSAWLGNDETHYVKKHLDKDVNDMKSFIQAMVYFIAMVLVTKTAAAIPPA